MLKVKGKPKTTKIGEQQPLVKDVVKGVQTSLAAAPAPTRYGRVRAQRAKTIDQPEAPTPKKKTPGKAQSVPPPMSPSRLPNPNAVTADARLQLQPSLSTIQKGMKLAALFESQGMSKRPQSQDGQQEQDRSQKKPSLVPGLAFGKEQLEELESMKVPATKLIPKYSWERKVQGRVVALYDGGRKGGEFLREASKYVSKLAILLDQTSFAPENKYCGQVSGVGKLTMKLNHFTVEVQVKDVQQVGGYFLHIGTVTKGILKVDSKVKCEVDYEEMKRKVVKQEQKLEEAKKVAEVKAESKYSKYPTNVAWVENKPDPPSTFKAKPIWTSAGKVEAGTGRTRECDEPIMRQLPEEPQSPVGRKKVKTARLYSSAGPTTVEMRQQADSPLLRQLPQFHKPQMVWTSFGPIPEYEMKDITNDTPMADRPLQRQPPIHDQKEKVMYTSYGPIKVKATKKKSLIKRRRPVKVGDRVSIKQMSSLGRVLATVLVKSGDRLYIDYDINKEPGWVKRDRVKTGRKIWTSSGPTGLLDDPSRQRDLPVRGSRVFLPKAGGDPATSTKEWATVLCQTGDNYSYLQFDKIELKPDWVTTKSISYIRPNTAPTKRIDPKTFVPGQLVHIPYRAGYTWAEIKSVSDGYLELICEDGAVEWAVAASILARPVPRDSLFSKLPTITRQMRVLVLDKTSKLNNPSVGRFATITDVDLNFNKDKKKMKQVRVVGKIIENLGDRYMDGKFVEVEYEDEPEKTSSGDWMKLVSNYVPGVEIPKALSSVGKKKSEWRNMGAVLRVFNSKRSAMDTDMLKPGMRVKVPKNSTWKWATIMEIDVPYAEVKYDDESLERNWVSMATFKKTCHVTCENQDKPSYSPVAKKRRPRKSRTMIKDQKRRALNKYQSPQKDLLSNKKGKRVVSG